MLLMNEVAPAQLIVIAKLKKRMRTLTALTLISVAIGGPIALLLFNSATGLVPEFIMDMFGGLFIFFLYVPLLYPLAGLAVLAAPLFASLLFFTALSLRAAKKSKAELVPYKGIIFRSFVLYALFWLVVALFGSFFDAATATEPLFWQNANGARGFSLQLSQTFGIFVSSVLIVLVAFLFTKGRKGMLVSEVALGIVSIFAILAWWLYWVIVLTVG